MAIKMRRSVFQFCHPNVETRSDNIESFASVALSNRLFFAKMIDFILIVNKSARIRLSKHYGDSSDLSSEERCLLEAKVTRACLRRERDAVKEGWVPFFRLGEHQIVYRKYTTMFFIVAMREEEVQQ